MSATLFSSLRMSNPIEYLRTRGATVHTYGKSYDASLHDVEPYDRNSSMSSAILAQLHGSNQVIGFYKHDESGYPCTFMFTGELHAETGAIHADRFYCKDGRTPPAVFSKKDFETVYGGKFNSRRFFRFLGTVLEKGPDEYEFLEFSFTIDAAANADAWPSYHIDRIIKGISSYPINYDESDIYDDDDQCENQEWNEEDMQEDIRRPGDWAPPYAIGFGGLHIV